MFLYNLFPKRLKQKLGKSKLLAPLRNLFFRNNGTYKEVLTRIERKYSNNLAQFNFYASIQVASKAKKQGIENTLLNNSIKLLKSDDDDRTIFDVGTNFGYLSLVWAKTLCKNGKVYSFEPHKYLFKSFIKSIKSSGLQNHIIAENLAVGNENGTIDINLLSATSNTLDLDNKKYNNKNEKTKIITLDNYIEEKNVAKCDLVKIDVDGIEYEILLGSQELINKMQPIFIVETNNDYRIIQFFTQNNYSILNMQLKPIMEGEIPENIFCLPKK